MKTITTLGCICAAAISSVSAQIVYREQPAEWQHIAEGGQFMDRILPMPKGKVDKSVWGVEHLLNRYVDNGIEDDVISYWGGNILKGNDGKFHLFLCGWDENDPKGHFGYPNSTVYHAVCDNSIGPFKVVDKLGHGHNPEIVPLADGSYMVYHVTSFGEKLDTDENLRYFYSKDINGPWELKKLKLDLRDRPVRLGGGSWFHNMSFTVREDGSVLAILRNGSIWVSQDGISPYHLITEKSIYPMLDGRYEDPVIWRDHIQYHVIVNDWIGRTAFYLRSKDGINWVQDPGTAYVPGVSVHEDGTVENWYKYERIRMYRDELGRAIQANFAVIDTAKHDDLMNDNHSSKNISIPLNKGMLLTILDTKPYNYLSKTITVKISAEQGFNPQTDVDVNSLRFGANSEVNYGRGAVAIKSENSGSDLIVTFEAKSHCIDENEFAPKMLGKSKKGDMIFGYARIPWMNYTESILSSRKPTLESGEVKIVVENHGQVASKATIATLNLYDSDGVEKEWGSVDVPPIKPYEKIVLTIKNNGDIHSTIKGDDSKDVVVKILHRDGEPVLFHTTI
ncbi:MAG: glycoside hydrolase family protein [Rikenellaceae bacterium]